MNGLYEAMADLAGDRTQRTGTARHAIVSAVDPVNHAVKVRIQPEDIESGWMPDPGLAAGGLRISCPCEIGTQVLAEAAEGDAEHPVIVGRLFDATLLPAVSPVTNKPAQPGELLISAGNAGPQGSNQAAAAAQTFIHQTASQIVLGVGQNTLTLDAQGLHLSIGGYATTLTASELLVGRPMQVNGDVVANEISVDSHVHGGVLTGGNDTTGPVA